MGDAKPISSVGKLPAKTQKVHDETKKLAEYDKRLASLYSNPKNTNFEKSIAKDSTGFVVSYKDRSVKQVVDSFTTDGLLRSSSVYYNNGTVRTVVFSGSKRGETHLKYPCGTSVVNKENNDSFTYDKSGKLIGKFLCTKGIAYDYEQNGSVKSIVDYTKNQVKYYNGKSEPDSITKFVFNNDRDVLGEKRIK